MLLFGARSSWAAFGFSSTVTIDHIQVPSTQTDFPVLISITDARFKTVGNSGHVENANGYDIRPFSDNACSSALTYELERYNATTGEVIMWVKIGSLSSSVDTVIYLGYGDAALNTNGSSTSTWSNSFDRVWHLKDGTTLSLSDSSATGDTLANGGGSADATAVTGQIDGGAGLANASSQHMDGSNHQTNAITYSLWAKATSFPNSYNYTISKNTAVAFNLIGVKSNGKMRWMVNATSQFDLDGTGSTTLSTGTLYYLTLTYDSTNGLKGYVNASLDNSAAANGVVAAMTSGIGIGYLQVFNLSFWDGPIDEVRLASVARSADWITTEYNNQSAPGTFETLGTEGTGCPAATPTATATATATATFTPTATATATATATFTPTATATATFTPTPTATFTPTATATATATATPTALPNAWFLFYPR